MTDEVYVDNAFHNFYDPPVTEITGLERLEGQTVQVLCDKAMQTDKVVTGGAITLDRPSQDVTVGLPYFADIKTLPIEYMVNDSSVASFMKRFARVFVRFNASALPKINNENIRKRHPASPMGVPEALISGDLKVSNLGWDRYGNIEITQELPYRTEIMGVYGELSLEGLK
jgi:hypothetical protein